METARAANRDGSKYPMKEANKTINGACYSATTKVCIYIHVYISSYAHIRGTYTYDSVPQNENLVHFQEAHKSELHPRKGDLRYAHTVQQYEYASIRYTLRTEMH